MFTYKHIRSSHYYKPNSPLLNFKFVTIKKEWKPSDLSNIKSINNLVLITFDSNYTILQFSFDSFSFNKFCVTPSKTIIPYTSRDNVFGLEPSYRRTTIITVRGQKITLSSKRGDLSKNIGIYYMYTPFYGLLKKKKLFTPYKHGVWPTQNEITNGLVIVRFR